MYLIHGRVADLEEDLRGENAILRASPREQRVDDVAIVPLRVNLKNADRRHVVLGGKVRERYDAHGLRAQEMPQLAVPQGFVERVGYLYGGE